MISFIKGFEKRASSWDIADDFATDMRNKKSPLAELANNFAANGSVPENSSDRKKLKREYIKYHKANINDTVSSRKPTWEKMKDKPKDTVSSGLKGSSIMGLLGMGLGGMGGAALGAPLKLLAKTRGIGKFMAPVGAAAGGLAGSVAGYKAGRHNPYYNMSEKGLKSSVDKEYDAPLHYINHQPFKKRAEEKVKGGMADGKPNSKYPKEQIEKGVKVEREHTKDPALAKEISKDHLEENPKYYTHLEKMEADMDKKGSQSHVLADSEEERVHKDTANSSTGQSHILAESEIIYE